MKQIFNDLVSLHYWFTVIVGVILAKVIEKRYDIFAERGSSWWAKKAKLRNQKRDKLINEIASDPTELMLAYLTQIQSMVASLGILATSGFMLQGVGIIPSKYSYWQSIMYIFPITGMVVGALSLSRAFDQADVVSSARNRRKKKLK